MTNWMKDLFNPQEQPRDLADYKRIPTEASVLTSVVIAGVLGRNASFVDKAAYVAYPFLIQEAAKRGAQSGYGDPKK